jgi:hypothetical protein
MRIFILVIILICFGLAHIPFLEADPDTMVSLHTRGAWTDEGLHTAQLRDFINHGKLDLYNNNSFIVSPFFNVILFPFFIVFGTNILVARVVVLVITLGMILLIGIEKKYSFAAALYAMLTLSQYYFFQFTHYAMTEIFAINFVLLAVYSLIRFEDSAGKPKKKYLWVIAASFFCFLAYATKIQFAYIAVIPPATFFLFSIIKPKPETISSVLIFAPSIISLFSSLLFALGYFLIWYLPHAEFYNFVLSYETSHRFAETIPNILEVYRFNFKHLIWVPELKVFLTAAVISLLGFAFSIFRKSDVKAISAPVIFTVIWFIAEQHKIAMVYLPTRYFLSYIAAAGLMTAFALSYFIGNVAIRKKLILALVVAIMFWQLADSYKSYQRRTYDIKAVSNYLRNYDFGDQPVLGVWAYTLAAGTKAQTIGVRYNYLNYHDPIKSYKPRLVITEFNEAESNLAYQSQGIDLMDISDSMRKFKVWRYDLELYWINQTLPDNN